MNLEIKKNYVFADIMSKDSSTKLLCGEQSTVLSDMDGCYRFSVTGRVVASRTGSELGIIRSADVLIPGSELTSLIEKGIVVLDTNSN